ncbi:MAG TPA: DUF3592 domain-containing protein [Pseudolabrys sp.]|nr:DUF3592 domain-containing protein [Pseudolabrys sp.]
MELDVNGKIIAAPAPDDIGRALDASSFPDDWYLTLDTETGALLDALAQGDGTFSLAHIDNDRRRNAVPNVDAAALKSICIKFLKHDHDWDAACSWQPEAPKGVAGLKSRFIPGAKPTASGKDGSPPSWAIGFVVAVIAMVGLAVVVEQWSRGSIRSHLPFGDSDFFWVGLIFLPMAALLLAAIASKLLELRQAQSWSQTTGKIVRSEMEFQRHRFAGEPETVRNVPAIEYEFIVRGSKIRGRRVGIGDDAGGANTEATLARYPLGTSVAVYYDPADPTHCVLEREGPKGLTTGGCALALIEVAVLAGALYWLIMHGPAFIDARFPKAESSMVVFAGVLGLVLLMFFIGSRRYSKQAANWPSVPGQIVGSSVESYQKRVDRTLTTFYRPAIEFAYTVHGLEYRGRQIKLGMEVDGSRAYAEKVVAKYAAGSAIDVHYDPANPATSALENPTGATWFVAVLALAAFAFAVWQLGIFK